MCGYLGKEYKIPEIGKEPLNYLEINKNDQKFYVHFDIMNSKSRKKIGSKSKILNINIVDEKYNKLCELDKTIGNIAPIPWPENENSVINTQKIHAALDDRWYLFLNLCKNEWQMWEKRYNVNISFNEYIISTCQQLYYRVILEDLKEKLKTLENKEITEKDLKEWMEEWDNIIQEGKNLELIDYCGTEYENIINDVLLIIEVRSKCIVLRLKDMMRNCKK